MYDDMRENKSSYFNYVSSRKFPKEEFIVAPYHHWYMYKIKFTIDEFEEWLKDQGLFIAKEKENFLCKTNPR